LLTNKEIKLLQSLDRKSERFAQGRFVVEGVKNIEELLKSDFAIELIYGVGDEFAGNDRFCKISAKEMERITHLKNASAALAVVKLPVYEEPDHSTSALLLDNVSDPGNLGTIIRTADWFGVSQIICSPNCVDAFSTKVVMSTMGSIFRVKLVYTDLCEYLKKSNLKSYAAVLGGTDVKKVQFNHPAALVVGSESHGISPDVLNLCTHKITITGKGQAESLNVGVATGILLNEFFR
jgi:RNA methyltransferase, TrmH family